MAVKFFSSNYLFIDNTLYLILFRSFPLDSLQSRLIPFHSILLYPISPHQTPSYAISSQYIPFFLIPPHPTHFPTDLILYEISYHPIYNFISSHVILFHAKPFPSQSLIISFHFISPIPSHLIRMPHYPILPDHEIGQVEEKLVSSYLCFSIK